MYPSMSPFLELGPVYIILLCRDILPYRERKKKSNLSKKVALMNITLAGLEPTSSDLERSAPVLHLHQHQHPPNVKTNYRSSLRGYTRPADGETYTPWG